MHETNEMLDRLLKEFAENYMEKLFYFCLKKTGNQIEAEDLAQDIALQIITALNRGTIPASFSAWVWQIARNRYCTWAKNNHDRNESVTGADIGDYEIEDESENVVGEIIHSEQMALLRRELAFIKSDYRNIVVAYYIENKSVREIAALLSLSESAVKQRLHRARMILKEGMDMAREFGVRSYKPEQIGFVMNGRDGKRGQPWSILGHLLYKNIFLAAYENPLTAEELSLELGMALPYMEDELEFLVREQLLRKEGDRYLTDFHIVSREEQRAEYEKNERVQEMLTAKICELIETYVREDGAKVNFGFIGYEAAKWALLVRAFDWLKWSAEEAGAQEHAYQGPYPDRPDDGAWVLTGYEICDFVAPGFVGQHGCRTYNDEEITKAVEFGQFKFDYCKLYAQTPEYLVWKETYNLWLICMGQSDQAEPFYVDKLLEYGYLKMENGIVLPNLVIFDRDAEGTDNAELKTKLTSLCGEIYELFAEAPAIGRGYVVEQALQNGWLTYDENTIKSVGAFIYK